MLVTRDVQWLNRQHFDGNYGHEDDEEIDEKEIIDIENGTNRNAQPGTQQATGTVAQQLQQQQVTVPETTGVTNFTTVRSGRAVKAPKKTSGRNGSNSH